MKLSKFNIEEELGDNLVIYNSLSSGILMLNEEYSNSYKTFKKTGVCDRNDLIAEFKRGGMIVDDDINEVEALNVASLNSRFNTNVLGLTIAPTLKCNFACPYCFEEGYRQNSMDELAKAKVIEFVKRKTDNISSLTVCWYGGEPLLQLKTIEHLTNEFKNNLKDNMSYTSSIVTNGYNLTKKVALKLKELDITRAQVTVDGPPDIHDKRRVLLNGQGSFERIFENIKNTHSIITISIRINVDKTNINRVDEILDYLENNGLKNKVSFYLACVEDSANSCTNPDCFETKEFSIEEIGFYKRALNRGFNSIYIPSSNIGICGAVSNNSYVIDPKGDLYKCWNEIGRAEEKVGDVFNGVKYNEKMTKWLLYNPLSNTDSKCANCTVLPVCFGGCPYITMKEKEGQCSSIRYNARHIISLLSNLKKADDLMKI
ncbi:radical SAM/SPASM domain-containing protein [Lysinibacillus capsici]|uniref:radical SAM/SPASM domain-containing protein n=2 Tax=Lysinibacillus capsici TaxID=2115968 RepID=UPI0028B046EC|nr:radical SAM protein [Lysinibacillus capsici]UNT57323.1 SPASM domain-containing protein [Lysinibacillus capsici]